MANPGPLADALDAADADFMVYGDDVRLVAEVENIEIEYAAMRKAVGWLDGPHRGLLRLTGRERNDFLHRLLTCDCRDLPPGDVRRGFLLNVKGRIAADLRLIGGDDETLIDVDVYEAQTVAAELDALLFGEDVQVANLSATHHRVSLHGPGAEAMRAWWDDLDKPAETWAYRCDEAAAPGLHLWAPAAFMTRFTKQRQDLRDVFKLRPVGWLAYNIARIEAATPLFHVDFGPDNIPNECGERVYAEAVSDTKGCYRGQEIVARIRDRGHPSKRLVGFRNVMPTDSIPVAGAGLLLGDGVEAETVGAVTSSTASPMRSKQGVGLAMVKWGHHEVGTKLLAPAAGRNVAIEIAEIPFIEHVEGHAG